MRIRDGWFGRQLRRFARSNDGAAALEFALVLPPLCLILVGMFEMSMLMFTQASMEGALREAARFGMTGSVSDPAQRQTQILAIIDERHVQYAGKTRRSASRSTTASTASATRSRMSTPTATASATRARATRTINGNAQWDADQGKAGVGAAAQIVQYTVQYDWHVITPFMAPVFGNNGKVHLKASIVLRNEPWDATTSSS